jgi:hypothetical protein
MVNLFSNQQKIFLKSVGLFTIFFLGVYLNISLMPSIFNSKGGMVKIFGYFLGIKFESPQEKNNVSKLNHISI